MSFFHAGPAPKGLGPRPGALRDGLGLQAGMKVGLFGGSFNPAHDGHAHVAETAMRRLDLDRVVVNEKARELSISNSGFAFGRNLFAKNVMGLWVLQCCTFWA